MGEVADVAIQALEAMDTQDYDRLQRLLADGVVMTAGGAELHGAGEIILMLEAHYAAFPDSVHKILKVIEAGDTVGLQMQVVATHEGTYTTPLGEFAGSGNAISWCSAAFIRVADGQAQQWTAYLDVMAIHREVGYVPTPVAEQLPAHRARA